MKKYLAVLALAGVFAACGNGSNSDKPKDSTAAGTTPPASSSTSVSDNPDYQKGLELIGKNDCLTCHAIAEKKIGPAYQDVAKKYAGQDTAVDHLAKKIIAGGSGVWGQVPMTPHPALAIDSAKQMVKYILLLNQQ